MPVVAGFRVLLLVMRVCFVALVSKCWGKITAQCLKIITAQSQALPLTQPEIRLFVLCIIICSSNFVVPWDHCSAVATDFYHIQYIRYEVINLFLCSTAGLYWYLGEAKIQEEDRHLFTLLTWCEDQGTALYFWLECRQVIRVNVVCKTLLKILHKHKLNLSPMRGKQSTNKLINFWAHRNNRTGLEHVILVISPLNYVPSP